MSAPEDKILTTPIDAGVALPAPFATACEKSAVVTLGQAFILLHRLRKQRVAGEIQEVSAEDLIAAAFGLCGLMANRLEEQSGLVEHVSGVLPTDAGEDPGPTTDLEPSSGGFANEADKGRE